MPFMEFIVFWNMYYAAMINIDKIVECYLFNTVLREIPDIWSFVIGQNVEILLPRQIPFFSRNTQLFSELLFAKYRVTTFLA